MNRLIFFVITCHLLSLSHAQANNDYFTEIAGDSVMSLSIKLEKKDVGDTAQIKLMRGLYRIVFNKGIKYGEGFDLKIINSKGQKVDFKICDGFIDFQNDSVDSFNIVMSTNHTIEEEVVGKFFLVYNINIKRDAPNLKLKDIDGNDYTNESLKGKIVVFNFWGVWCKPCKMEIPQLNNLVKYYSDRQDVVFLAVSSDSKKDLMRFLKKTKFNYQLILDNNALDLSLELNDIGYYAVPSHAVLDKNGDIVFQYLGEHQSFDQMLKNCIEKHL